MYVDLSKNTHTIMTQLACVQNVWRTQYTTICPDTIPVFSFIPPWLPWLEYCDRDHLDCAYY
jgi:hypothetical protein